MSPFLAMRRIEEQMKSVLRTVDVDFLGVHDKKIVNGLRRLLIDARLDVRDYELSETRDEQIKKAFLGKKRLIKLNKAIIDLYNVFGPADVAHLSAQVEYVSSRLI